MAGKSTFSLMDLVHTIINRRQAQNMEGDAPEAVAMTRQFVTGQDSRKVTERPSSGQLSRAQEIAIINRNRERRMRIMEQLQAADRR